MIDSSMVVCRQKADNRKIVALKSVSTSGACMHPQMGLCRYCTGKALEKKLTLLQSYTPDFFALLPEAGPIINLPAPP